MNPRITLKAGKAKPVLAHHPWIFSGAIARADDAQDGDTVDIFDSAGRWIARGYYNARSQITARVWTCQDEPIDRAFLRARFQRALAARDTVVDQAATNAYRLVNAESDLLPGLVVDRYADTLVMQFLTLGVEKRKTEFVEIAQELLEPHSIYERSDVDVREKEGLAEATGVLCGAEPPERILVHENKLVFAVDVKRGHKTGFYLDQRENRRRVVEFLSPAPQPAEILNVFSYTGGFGVYACAPNPAARVVNLDASLDALNLARENMQLNGVADQGECVQADAFQMLRRYRDQARFFDTIILDPPKFVQAKSQLQSGLRGYKDINLLALKLLKPGGTLVTCSCSGQVSPELFQQVIFEAAVDAKRDVQIVARLLQAPDHPILLSFPESEYLKGLVCRVMY